MVWIDAVLYTGRADHFYIKNENKRPHYPATRHAKVKAGIHYSHTKYYIETYLCVNF